MSLADNYEELTAHSPKYAPLLYQDQQVADWCFQAFRLHPYQVNMAIGILDEYRNLCGAALFHWFNGTNIELSYYGTGTPTLGIGRLLARIALHGFKVSRVTIHTELWNTTVIDGMKKFGFQEEGVESEFYGEGKDAIRLVLFKDGLIKIAGKLKGH